jgi:hypothetical protein
MRQTLRFLYQKPNLAVRNSATENLPLIVRVMLLFEPNEADLTTAA